MSPPETPDVALAEGFEAALADAPADERVYRVALELYEPTRVATVADRADCAPDTARRHLERLAHVGVLDRVTEAPATYERNASYFEWRKRNRLEERSTEELQEQLAELSARDRSFKQTYAADHPGAVDALEHADYDRIEEVWLDLSEWRTVRRRIRRLEAVRQNRASETSSEAA
jgi:predicted ArsR family transcriptional regulator